MSNSMTVLIESIEENVKNEIGIQAKDYFFEQLKNSSMFVDKYTEINGGTLAWIGYFEDPYEKVDEMKVGDCTEKPPFFTHFPLEEVYYKHFPKIFSIYTLFLQKKEDNLKIELVNALNLFLEDFEEKLINCHDLSYKDVENFFAELEHQTPTL